MVSMIPDRIERRMRPTRLGMIGLGVTVGDHPKEVEYFVVVEEIAKIYGDKPTRLPVRFPWPEPEQVLHSVAYVLRKGRSVVGRCDGQQFIEIQADGKDLVRPCKLPPDDDYAQCPMKCRPSARLSVVVAKTPLGIWEVRVGGAQRIADLLGQLRLYRAAVGPLTQFPFEIERVEVQEQYFKASGEVAWRKGYPIRVRSPYTVEQVAAIQEARGLPVALPPAPHEEDILDEDETNGTTSEPTREPDRRTAQPAGPLASADTGDEAQRTGESGVPVAREAPAPAPAGEGLPAPPGPAQAKPERGVEPAGAGPGAVLPREAKVDEPLANLLDVSMCYKLAAECGMTPELYERYFEAHHGVRTGDAPDAVVAREAAEFRALASEGARLTHKSTLIRRLNEALKAKGVRR